MTFNKDWNPKKILTPDSLNIALSNYFNESSLNIDEIREIRESLSISEGETLKVELKSAETLDFLNNFYTDIMKVKTVYELSNPRTKNKPIREHKTIAIKRHANGNSEYDRTQLESEVLKCLSHKSKRIPTFYYYDRDNKVIYMKNIEGTNFNKLYDTVDDFSLKILRSIMSKYTLPSNPPSSKGELNKNFGDNLENVLLDLEERKLIQIVVKTVAESKVEYIPTLRAFSRFNREGKDNLSESKDFIEERSEMIKKVITNLVLVQKIGNENSELLRNYISCNSTTIAIREDMELIDYIIRFNTQKERNIFTSLNENQIQILGEILKKINGPLTENCGNLERICLSASCSPIIQFNQGDAFGGNHLIEGDYPYLIDFDKSNFSFFGNDIIDFLNSVSLFTDEKDPNKYYNFALNLKKSNQGMIQSQRDMGKAYLDIIDTAFEDKLPLAKVKRTLRTVGVLSKVLLKNKDIETDDEVKLSTLEKYEKIRGQYYNYLYNLLESISEGKQLMGIFNKINGDYKVQA